MLLDQDKIEEAAAATERALALNPNNHDAVNLMGRVAFERGDLDAALAYYRRALALKPDLADAYNNMGNVLKELGRLQEAQDAYLEALRLDPSVTGVYVNLADSKKFAPGDPHLAAMEALAAKTEGLSKTDRMQLDFALGKAYADLKTTRRSFKHLLAGNAGKARDDRLRREIHLRPVRPHRGRFHARTDQGEIRRRRSFAAADLRHRHAALGNDAGRADHRQSSAVHGAGELQTLNDVILTVRGPDGNTIPYPEFVPALDARRYGRSALPMWRPCGRSSNADAPPYAPAKH